MDVTTISQIIGSMGFPIAACIAMFWFLNEETKSHKEETKNMTEALNDMRLAIVKLTDAIDRDN